MLIKLERGNDWGYEYFALPGKAKINGYCNGRSGLKFIEGKSVNIRWPDGYLTSEKIVNKTMTSTVHEMGHDCVAEYTLAGFYTSIHGIKQWVPLDSVEIDFNPTLVSNII